MSDFSVPRLPVFVRDRLAEHLDGLGHIVSDVDERDGFPCLTVETWDGSLFEDVAVQDDGRIMSMVDGWTEVRLRGFSWQPVPTDTGIVHGPRADRATDSLARTVYVVGEQRHAVYPEQNALLLMRGAFRGQQYPTAARVGAAILWPMRGVHQS